MDGNDRIYFAGRLRELHQELQRAYLERASVGARPQEVSDPVG